VKSSIPLAIIRLSAVVTERMRRHVAARDAGALDRTPKYVPHAVDRERLSRPGICEHPGAGLWAFLQHGRHPGTHGNGARPAVLRFHEGEFPIRDVGPSQREQFADTSARNQREPHDPCEAFRTGLQQRGLFLFAQDARPSVVDLQPLDPRHRMLDQVSPLDRFREDAAQRVEFTVHGGRRDGLRRARVPMPAPFPAEPFPLELFNSMRREFVQDERAKRPIQNLQNEPVAPDAPLMELGMVGEVRFAN
jgi:hypothetical protein